jgi:hypothetical protein
MRSMPASPAVRSPLPAGKTHQPFVTLGGKMIRRRACRRCKKRLTTWEKGIGG